MRKLACIKKIAEIKAIPGADQICAYRVDGWWIVDRVNAHNINDLVVAIEIDSFVPHELAPFLSRGQEPSEYNGVKGNRLRTVRLKGQISQGLLLPFGVVLSAYEGEACSTDWNLGDDVTELLGIQKWEPPVPAQLSGQVRGPFPHWGKKTDAERCQNLIEEIQQAYDNDTVFEITVKLDGTSMSAGMGPGGDFHVCSRNLSLGLDQTGNTYVDVAKAYDLENKVVNSAQPMLISGEIIGEGIQKNQEKIKGQDFYVFNIWDALSKKYMSREERMKVVEEFGLKHTPILHEAVTLRSLGLDTIEKILKFAEGPSLNAASREGLVFKSVDGEFMFKAISNSWLAKNE